MKTPDQVLEQDVSPAEAALELVRRFEERDDLAAIATKWCERTARRGARPDLGHQALRAAGGRRDPVEAIFRLVELATKGHVVLEDWTARARDAGPDGQRSYEVAMLSLVIALWPHRERVAEFESVVHRWAREADLGDRVHVADLLADCPDLAHALLGPANYVPTPHGACFGCAKHPRGPTDSGVLHLRLVLARRRRKLAPHPLDDAILAAIPAEALVREPMLIALMRDWLAGGLEPPPGLWASADATLRSDVGHDWYGAVVLQFASRDRQDDAIQRLADLVRSSKEPASAFSNLVHDRWWNSGVFSGPGWGRDGRPRKLLPLTRALLDRRIWPLPAWVKALRPSPGFTSSTRRSDDDDPDHIYDWVSEVLAEGFLADARNTAKPPDHRHRALDALERLGCTGKGSWARALSTVTEPPGLRARAREVQRSVSRTERQGGVDPELAVRDACEIYGCST